MCGKLLLLVIHLFVPIRGFLSPVRVYKTKEKISFRVDSLLVTHKDAYFDVEDNYSESFLQFRENSSSVHTTSFVLPKDLSLHVSPWKKRLTKLLKRRRSKQKENVGLKFQYDYDQIVLGPLSSFSQKNVTTTGVVLIHPIGVGIGKWFYQRLFNSLLLRSHQSAENNNIDKNNENSRFLFCVPDLLGSGSACNPIINDEKEMKALPLLNISDWTDQIIHCMEQVEIDSDYPINNWCIVANGGCSPIALQVAQRAVELADRVEIIRGSNKVSQVILSSVPRLTFFLESTNPEKVAKSYRTLCGLPGRLFWWYSCRKNGAFIKKFSEKNLVADPNNLGPNWTKNCVQTAKMYRGKSRYSTFAFLAGALQDGCQESLNTTLNHSLISIDFIKGRDIRRNRAKSWFWQKKKKQKESHTTRNDEDIVTTIMETPHRETIRDYVQKNSKSGGREMEVGGRISLAHEDAQGYADALMKLVYTNSTDS